MSEEMHIFKTQFALRINTQILNFPKTPKTHQNSNKAFIFFKNIRH